MLKIRVLLLLTCAATILFTATALAEGQAGCSFSGTVSLDDAQVAGGTRITAVIEGDEYNTHTAISTPSKYFITVRAPEGKTYPDGAKVTFKVNGYTAKQKGVFKAGTSQKLDLTASTTSALQGVFQNSWGIVGLVIALLAAGGAAYYFLDLRQRQPRPVRVSAFSAVKRYLPGILQGRISGKTSAYDPSAPYVWDKSKLAWVENPKAAVTQSPEEKAPTVSEVKTTPTVEKTAEPKTRVPPRKRAARYPRRDF